MTVSLCRDNISSVGSPLAVSVGEEGKEREIFKRGNLN